MPTALLIEPENGVPVSVSVIDWTTTGAPPPIFTPPTEIWRFEAMRAASLPRGPAVQVVRERDEEHEQDQREADHGRPLVDLARDGAAADALDDREEDVPAVERQQRQQVQEREREADQAEDLDVRGDAH